MSLPTPSTSKRPRKPISRTPSFLLTTPRRAVASFENLVALANDQERLREARKIIWRDRGDPVVEVTNLEECLDHALKGGIRAGTLGFGIRGGVNLFILLFRIVRTRQLKFSLVLHAVFGKDTWRFAAMLGSFTGLYRFILNALPILIPAPIISRPPLLPTHSTPGSGTRTRTRKRTRKVGFTTAEPESPDADGDSPNSEEDSPILPSLTETNGYTEPPTPLLTLSGSTPTSGDKPPQTRETLEPRSSHLTVRAQFLRKKTKRWHAVLAGLIAGGLGVSFEARSRRLVIAQQMFVRGLQGGYRAYTRDRGIQIPHGDVLVFALCCGQILYAFLLRPDTIPRSYVSWIQAASMTVGPETVSMNRDLVRDGKFKFEDIQFLIDSPKSSAKSKAYLMARLAAAKAGDFGAHVAPCEAVHPWLDRCLDVPLERFWTVFRWMIPVYGALHTIPMVLFKRHAVFQEPGKMFLRAFLGTGRSAAFLGTFVLIYQTYFCAKHNLYNYLTHPTLPSTSLMPSLQPLFTRLSQILPPSLIALLISKPSFFLGGLLSGLSLFIEDPHRRPELAMYVLPKGLESVWKVARGKGLVPKEYLRGRLGESVLCALGMGVVMGVYQNEPHALSGLVRRVLYQFIGPN
ncbi:hypothetical protein SISNIDRAFT_491000 [Sistotremastrum niveocremeum HHB9708]|uniref:Transmembrane protein 135 N-terminal domain-containing protein n=1 Tax=Sistotremastrum niveocremeum HHB9708 TaxID=1314777 RepID=A0A164NB91_9AGAM|nr:hypothetical protein SISNIDRAFT_491000 [Sistotremastrum niveocremeum HHB9708]